MTAVEKLREAQALLREAQKLAAQEHQYNVVSLANAAEQKTAEAIGETLEAHLGSINAEFLA